MLAPFDAKQTRGRKRDVLGCSSSNIEGHRTNYQRKPQNLLLNVSATGCVMQYCLIPCFSIFMRLTRTVIAHRSV